jgi:hypothetical protein
MNNEMTKTNANQIIKNAINKKISNKDKMKLIKLNPIEQQEVVTRKKASKKMKKCSGKSKVRSGNVIR